MASSTSGKNVLLGFQDENIQKEITTWTVNKIGGMPDKLPGLNSWTLETKCEICGRVTPLVVQLYCPLGDSAHHRTLYVFCCINEQCWNKPQSWKVMRCQFLEPNSNSTDIQNGLSKPVDPWLMEEDTWGDEKAEDSTRNDSEERLVDEATHMTLSSSDREPNHSDDVCYASAQKDETCSMVVAESPPKCLELPSFMLRSESRLPENVEPKFCTFYINVFEETKSSDCAPAEHIQTLMESYYRRDGNPFYSLHESSSKKTSGIEGYEKTEVKHGDKIFHKFLKQVADHPQQIIRYSWNGEPLHMTQQPASDMTNPPCQYCGSRMVFELQLMPALVHSLKLQDAPTHDTPVEFGTVIVITCENSCWNDGDSYKLEHIVLEVDPDDLLFKRENVPPVLEINKK